MSTQTWFIVGMSFFILAAILLIVSAVLFVRLNIRSVFDHLFPHYRKKQIPQTKVKHADPMEQPGSTLPQYPQKKRSIPPSPHDKPSHAASMVNSTPATAKSTNTSTLTSVNQAPAQTQFAGSPPSQMHDKTAALPQSASDRQRRTATSVFKPNPISETMMLPSTQAHINNTDTSHQDIAFRIVKNVMVIHTNEIIEQD